jgi:serine/threonine protein kinase
MQPERVERVKFLLASALAKPLNEREAYLDAACNGDAGLRRDIEQYLSAGEKTEQFVYHPEPVDTVEHYAQVTSDPKIGKAFGKYVIRRRLAEGGMGVVYLAVDNQLGREVALKILPEYFILDKDRLARFHREARATSLLNHPNIVTVFELGQIENCEFIVTEYVAGETLRQKLDRGPIPFVEMIKIASQVAGALGAAHKAGVVHRDIKPENVMIRPDGYVKVLDFGLAKLSDAMGNAVSGGGSLHNRTVPGMIMGTAAYMSPEQAEGIDVDARTDIWAVGVLLYEMACGKLPFQGPTPSHTIVAILEHEPAPYEHPSEELRQIITTALQKDPQLRFQTADAMSEALDGVRNRLGYISDQTITKPSISEKDIPVERPDARPVKEQRSSRKLLWLVPTAFVVLAIGALGIYGVIATLSMFSSTTNSNSSVRTVTIPSPSPTATIESVAATPEPIATPLKTPETVYVAPTPEPTPITEERSTVERVQRNDVRKTEPPPVPPRTPVRVEVKPTPVKKPKPAQDPNCVFTDECH